MHLVIIGGRQIGDLILQQSAIIAAIGTHKPSRVTLFVSPLVKPIVGRLDLSQTIEAKEYRPSWGKHPWGHQHDVSASEAVNAVGSFISELRDLEPNALVVLDKDPWLTNSPELGRVKLDHLVTWDPDTRLTDYGHQSWRFHNVVRSSALLATLNCPDYQTPRLKLDRSHDAVHDYMTLQHRITGAQSSSLGVVVIQPKGSYPSKDVSPATWGNIIKGLTEMGYCPILIGVASDTFETEASETTKRLIRKAVDWRGELTLPQTFDLLHQADLTIGVDSFAVHTVGAYGNADELFNGQFICLFSSTNDPCQWGASGRPGQGRIFCLPPWNREKYPLGLTAYPAGTKGWPYTERIRADDVLDAAHSMLAIP